MSNDKYASLSNLRVVKQWIIEHFFKKDDVEEVNEQEYELVDLKLSKFENDRGFITSNDAAETYVAKESGKGLSSNDYTTAEKNKLAGIEAGAQKNPTAVSQLDNDAQYLKLQEVKPNGNIVLTDGTNSREYMAATPSGDPMHYAYVAAGAEYNGTGLDITKTAPWGDQVTHKAGYWYLNGLGDLTNEEMVIILNYGYVFGNNYQFYLQGRTGTRTNLPKENSTMMQTAISLYGVVYQNYDIVVFSLSKSGQTTVGVNNLGVSFQNCQNLEAITDVLNASSVASTSNAFFQCYKLRHIMLKNLKVSVDLKNSSMIYNSCILYMIANAQTTANFTITLHADAYARAMADPEIQEALATKTNVSLASA